MDGTHHRWTRRAQTRPPSRGRRPAPRPVSWFMVYGSGFRVQGSGFRVQGAGFRVQGAGFRVQGSGFRVQGSGFRVQGAGCRVQGSGFRVTHLVPCATPQRPRATACIPRPQCRFSPCAHVLEVGWGVEEGLNPQPWARSPQPPTPNLFFFFFFITFEPRVE